MHTEQSRNLDILLVDDDPLVRFSLGELFSLDGYSVEAVENAHSALNAVRSASPEVIITDIRMQGMDGFKLLEMIKGEAPETIVILMTAYATVEEAVSGMKMGAFEYVRKPLDDNRMKTLIKDIFEEKTSRCLGAQRRTGITDIIPLDVIVGNAPKMQQIFEQISVVANTQATILINGESGTGKSTVARAIHLSSSRKNSPLMEISCGALSENLLESELFGHVKGAFTGAMSDKVGKIQEAGDGTIFLDEIDTLSPRLQVKLLRFLQDRKFERVGSTETIQSHARVIAAANRDLRNCVAKAEFREDLFYRLNVVSFHLPPLRDRSIDIPLFLKRFVEKYNAINRRGVHGVTDEVMNRFLSYGWPGNVRELENAIERAVILCTGSYITYDLLPDYLKETEYVETQKGLMRLNVAVEEAEKETLINTLRHFKGNRNKTADFLEINRTTLYQKMKKYGLLDRSFGV
jgi:DNA-binding NtrC family response regulator